MISNVFLKELLEAAMVFDYEEAGEEVVRRHMEPVSDTVLDDDTGDTICMLNSDTSPRTLVMVHLDEIGLMVSVVMEKGWFTTICRRGIVPTVYPGHRVLVMTGNGSACGMVESYRDFFQKKGGMDAKNLLTDIGVDTREGVLALVESGSSIVFNTGTRVMVGGRFFAGTLDNQLGVYIVMGALKRTRERVRTRGVYDAATVGEETTRDGAYRTAYRVRLGLVIVVDVTYTCDCTGTSMVEAGDVKLGGGPVLCGSSTVPKRLNRTIRACADSAGIRVQIEAASALSYMDADKVHFAQEGIPMVLVSILLHYMHHPAEMVDGKDVEDRIILIIELLARYQELDGAK